MLIIKKKLYIEDYENPELAYKETFAYLKVQAIVAKFSSKGGEGMSMMLFQNNLIAISGVAVAIALNEKHEIPGKKMEMEN
ncbi:hypothetical protein RhiirA4_463445 [Rhizophagus irregularis]|uniref:Uncharacterized protein n=1 Tax=Rhizophagus irregularis TaxID=588596 RepID=A0A2I1GN42_9GLOM|nr:hypothetical protein RhiirA4_463445 [Rhizophagus irregularis]